MENISTIVESRSCPSELLKGLYARTRDKWQVADVRRHFVSATHIIQAGSELFIGKNKVYIKNRKKKESSVIRKEDHVNVLDLFVKVTSHATAPINCKPMKVADGRERRKQVTFAGGVSVRDKSRRAETVRPLHDEHCEHQFVCDSPLRAFASRVLAQETSSVKMAAVCLSSVQDECVSATLKRPLSFRAMDL